MENSCCNSMGVPLPSSLNHLTASSSAIANYSRITLHSFNSAASQALLFGQKLWCTKGWWESEGLVERLLWDCHATVKKTARTQLLVFVLLDPENARLRPPEDCVESVLKILGDRKKVFFKWGWPQADVVTCCTGGVCRDWQARCRLLNPKCDILPFSLLFVSHRSSWTSSF